MVDAEKRRKPCDANHPQRKTLSLILPGKGQQQLLFTG